MENTTKSYQIVLPKGKANPPFLELNDDQVREVSRTIFERVKERARKAGVVPVTNRTVSESNSK